METTVTLSLKEFEELKSFKEDVLAEKNIAFEDFDYFGRRVRFYTDSELVDEFKKNHQDVVNKLCKEILELKKELAVEQKTFFKLWKFSI